MVECELCKEIEHFLRHQGSGIARHFENKESVMPLAYFADIFSGLNDLNTSIQGTAMNMTSKGVRKGEGLGLNPPLSLIFYKNFITLARRLIAFAYFLLVNLST